MNGSLQDTYLRLAEGVEIKEIRDGLYAIDDHAYYLKVEGNAKPFARNSNGNQELVVPAAGQFKYTILF